MTPERDGDEQRGNLADETITDRQQREALDACHLTERPCCRTPIATPPKRFTSTITTAAIASPLTNFRRAVHRNRRSRALTGHRKGGACGLRPPVTKTGVEIGIDRQSALPGMASSVNSGTDLGDPSGTAGDDPRIG